MKTLSMQFDYFIVRKKFLHGGKTVACDFWKGFRCYPHFVFIGNNDRGKLQHQRRNVYRALAGLNVSPFQQLVI